MMRDRRPPVSGRSAVSAGTHVTDAAGNIRPPITGTMLLPSDSNEQHGPVKPGMLHSGPGFTMNRTESRFLEGRGVKAVTGRREKEENGHAECEYGILSALTVRDTSEVSVPREGPGT